MNDGVVKMRSNIFERLQESGYCIDSEIRKIHTLFDSNVLQIKQVNHYASKPETFQRAVDMFAFHSWKQRGSLLNLYEFKEKVGIIEIQGLIEAYPKQEITDGDKIMLYLEYILNIFLLALKVREKEYHIHNFENYRVIFDDIKINMLRENIDIMLDNLNFGHHLIKDDEKIIITEKNAAVTAASEIVAQELLIPTIEYNHHLLQGNIERKQEILKKFADDLEPKRKELKNLNQTTEDTLFYMFNKLNIRHNNSDIEIVANMDDEELEGWYDEIYQLILYCYLILDNKPRVDKLKDLKSKITR